MNWLIADTHFQHAKIIEYCGRPPDFEAQIYKSWRRKVRPADTIYHLGDVVFGDWRKWYEEVFPTLPGHKVLIMGNHDRMSARKCKELGWDEVYQQYKFKIGKYRVILQHRPGIPKDGSDWIIHGHCHNAIKQSESYGKCLLTAPEWDGYKVLPMRKWFYDMIRQRA
jgi:calcineurin-like phosphoesterase family protein